MWSAGWTFGTHRLYNFGHQTYYFIRVEVRCTCVKRTCVVDITNFCLAQLIQSQFYFITLELDMTHGVAVEFFNDLFTWRASVPYRLFNSVVAAFNCSTLVQRDS